MRPPIRPNANTAECWLLQCFTIPTALRISGSGISRPLFPIHGVLRASVVSLQLVEQWCGFLGAASWRVVGPGWGNGKAAAVLFVAREGPKVLCADVNQNAADETVEIIRQENGTANAVCADVTSHDDIRRMVKACTEVYGRIDVVDYNVGLAHVGGVVCAPA